ncbi:MAG: hypothetical protein RLZZ72_1053 [Actinomycetota bacterium]|jgi:uncharacterized membrane protein
MTKPASYLTRANNFLDKLGVKITSVVGTMWAAIAFSMLALVSLPAALASGNTLVIVSWFAQTFLQLVLLPIIMVGQAVQARKTEKRDNETHQVVMAAHQETQQILRELHKKQSGR